MKVRKETVTFGLRLRQLAVLIVLAALALANLSCGVSSANEKYFGKTEPPARNILRYVTGDEPATLDPQMSTGQPEGRIYMALYEGLTEYDPKTMKAIPAIAERWEANREFSEFVFHLRQNARWSNGDKITANDFVYSFRRGLSRAIASSNANLGYSIAYAQAYNAGKVFVRDQQTNQFLLEKDLATGQEKPTQLKSPIPTTESTAAEPPLAPDTLFHQWLHTPPRVTLPGDEPSRNKLLAQDARLKAAVDGKEFVKVRAEDIGVEAVSDYVLRITLHQPAPFFVDLMPNQFFRLVPQRVVEQFKAQWSEPAHIVTCGPFKLKSWKPYDDLVVERDPLYWDAANVHLDEIHFYPMNDNTTIMNLYKVGEVDAVLNHTVPIAWLDLVKLKQDYMDAPEAATVFILMNVTRPPMNDLRVRQAFNLAIDKASYVASRKITKRLSGFTPEGIFPGYPQPKGKEFDPDKARQLMTEAGFPVTKRSDGSYECKGFPTKEVEYLFNTQTSNKTMAEIMQAQWKQNLGITVSLRNMESKTFLEARAKLDYKGFALGLWGGDYMDPFTFLNYFYTGGTNGSGWADPKYVEMLDEGNHMLDPQKRYELLAKAEQILVDAQPFIPIETSSVRFVKKPYVKGMYASPGSMYAWKFVYIERDQSKWDAD
jgi:oligopeptide transport system substrate-binding protein